MNRGRPPIPLSIALATGEATRQKTRFEGRLEAEAALEHIPLGPVPPVLTRDPLCVQLWSEFVAEFPWLRESDRKLVTLACLLMWDVYTTFELMEEPTGKGKENRSIGLAPNATFSQLRQILSLMGGTPSTIGRLMLPKKDEKADKPKKGSSYRQGIDRLQAA